MAHPPIRPSQYVFTWGPGTLLETPSGPVVMKNLYYLAANQGIAEKCEIPDPALCSLLEPPAGAQARLVKIPSNAEAGTGPDSYVMGTLAFPGWSLCTKHKRIYRSVSGCPECPRLQGHALAERSGRQAIRWVLACPDGHLDDVDWHRIAHPEGGGCRSESYLWMGGSRSLSHVNIQCEACGSSGNLGTAYGRDHRCRGRHPQNESAGNPVRPGCAVGARMILKSATNLRLPRTVTALSLAGIPSAQHEAVSHRAVQELIRQGHPPAQVRTFATSLVAMGLLPGHHADALQQMNDIALQRVIEDMAPLAAGQGATGDRILRPREFQRLRQAAAAGCPPAPGPGGRRYLFQVNQDQVTSVDLPGHPGVRIRVTPVEQLRVVAAQVGFAREVRPPGPAAQAEAALVPSYHLLNNVQPAQAWYPAIDLQGEGIFLDLAPDSSPLNLGGPRAAAWDLRPGGEGFRASLPTGALEVWWHTLAHRLVRATAIDSGYSSASIRERTFPVQAEPDGSSSCGVLLYTASPGGDGTLGGLCSLASRFGKVLRRAMDGLEVCSNDPLCSEHSSPEQERGACCHACLLNPETSCEHMNSRLDRLLLAETSQLARQQAEARP